MKKRLKIQFYGDPLNDSEVFDRTWIIQLYWGLHDSPSFGSSCGRLVLVLWCLHLNPTLSLVVFYLKTTRNSAIRKRKESLAVEKRCVVWVWKSTETFQKCFTFHFQRWIVVYLWHTVFFFILSPTERLLAELKSALGLGQYRRNTLEMHVAYVYFRVIPDILMPGELHETMWNCFTVQGDR